MASATVASRPAGNSKEVVVVKAMTDPYEKLRRAHEENHGTNLTAEDVDRLMDDVAIHDAVYQVYADEQQES